jgi:hypothetical protein
VGAIASKLTHFPFYRLSASFFKPLDVFAVKGYHSGDQETGIQANGRICPETDF